MKLLLFIYLFPLILWWSIVLIDKFSTENTDNKDSTFISNALNVLSFVPIFNWIIALEVYKNISKKLKKIIDD